MLIRGNITRGPLATLVLAAAVVRPAAAAPTADGPDPTGVVAAYLALMRWTDGLAPPDPDDAAARLPIEGAEAVCVQLRRRGRVVGTGIDRAGPGIDAAGMVRRAAGRALSAVLGDPVVAAVPELEVAGGLVPLPGRTFARLAEQIEPGLDGIAIRRGDATRLLFPAQMRATNRAANVERLLPSLAVDLGLPSREPAELAERFGARYYRFRTIHLAQRGPGRQPFETMRGQVIVPIDRADRAGVDELAEGLANNLISRLWRGDEPLGLMGDYRLVADTYDPIIAGPRDQALAAFALARLASVPDRAEPSEAVRMRTAAETILALLALVHEGEADPRDDPGACAAIVLAATELPGAATDPVIAPLLADAAARVRACFPDALPPGAHARALLAHALSRLHAADPAPGDADAARRVLDETWEAVPAHQRITLLPWFGWAEVELAAATGAPIGHAGGLRALRELLDASRIGPGGVAGPEDLRGGLALVATGRARASAQTTRPAAWLATMLAHPALTPPAERPAADARHRETMRFLMQLAVDDTMLWAVRTPQRAKGGLRASTWNTDQPVAAQAMGLLTAAETLRAWP
jgi:hypothetical protein